MLCSADFADSLRTGAEEERVTEALGAFANRGVDFVFFVPFRSFGDESQRNRGLPVLIDAGEECLRIGAVVECGEIVREAAIL
jgi:hypothetical protein